MVYSNSVEHFLTLKMKSGFRFQFYILISFRNPISEINRALKVSLNKEMNNFQIFIVICVWNTA